MTVAGVAALHAVVGAPGTARSGGGGMCCGTADVAGVAALPEPEAGAMAAMAAMASACHLMKWLQHECVSHVTVSHDVMRNTIQPKMHKNATKTKKLKTCPEVSQVKYYMPTRRGVYYTDGK